jgi:hypothetical protein
MADIKQLETALINADAAGDTEAATILAGEIMKMRSVETPQEPQPLPKPTMGQKAERVLGDVPRQIGLTARHGIEGIGNSLDFVATPVRAGMNAIAGEDKFRPGGFRGIADSLGLPSPRNAQERVVGDIASTMAGTGGFMGLAKGAAQFTQGIPKTVLSAMGSNPGMQTASAAGAGAAGGTAREAGFGPAGQFAASLFGGIASPLALHGAQSLARTGTSAFRPINGADAQLENALNNSGTTLADLPASARLALRNDIQQALKTGDNLDDAALKRLIDYRMTGATPTQGPITLDPALITRQRNLSKMGANSVDPKLQELARIENQNNKTLIQGLNNLGASTSDDAYSTGGKVINALQGKQDFAQSKINRLYEQARNTDGRSAALNPSEFTNRANDLLDNALLGGKLPGDVRNLLNRAATGEMPLTVDVAEQFKTRIGDLQRATRDGAERKSLSLVRQALDETPLMDAQGVGAVEAFNRARSTNRAWMGVVEKTPALQAVRDGVEPDKFVQDFIIGNGKNANVMDVMQLKKLTASNPDAQQSIRSIIAQHLKSKALGGAADEVGNFSASNFDKALSAIGDRKLNAFFSPEEVSQLKAISRVARYEQFQPRGSAVNNSNTAGTAMMATLEMLGNSPLLRKIPFGESLVGGPAQNIAASVQAKRLLNAPGSIVAKPPARSPQVPVAPFLAMPGLLSIPE